MKRLILPNLDFFQQFDTGYGTRSSDSIVTLKVEEV